MGGSQHASAIISIACHPGVIVIASAGEAIQSGRSKQAGSFRRTLPAMTRNSREAFLVDLMKFEHG